MTDERKATVAVGYDQLAEVYLEWSRRSIDPARGRMLAEFMRRLPPAAAVLDLGCGAGLPTTAALANRFVVTGIDTSAVQLAAARRNVPTASFVEGDFASADFPEASFDGISAFYAISHVPRDEHAALFDRIHRWLRPDGLFVASLGAHDSPDWTGVWLGTLMFFSSFGADTNRRLLRAAGFELLTDDVVETVEPEGPVPFLWVLARKSRLRERLLDPWRPESGFSAGRSAPGQGQARSAGGSAASAGRRRFGAGGQCGPPRDNSIDRAVSRRITRWLVI